MGLDLLNKIEIYKKNSLYADFLFSYPSTYLFKNNILNGTIGNIKHDKNLLYVHIPFCFEICAFCNVNKTKLNSSKQIDEYLSILFDEIDFFKSKLEENIYFEGVYIGGGTPTVLSEIKLEKLFKKIFNSFKFKDNFSFEIDAHPSTLNHNKLDLFKLYDVQQISMGIQSIEPTVMDSINRKGQNYTILNNLSKLLSKYNFKLHFDFIIGLPNESIINLKKDVCYIAESFKPYSISVNGYDNTIDTDLFKTNKLDFRTKKYKEDVSNNINIISNILEEKYGITRKTTFYFNNFFANLYNVIGIGSGSYGYIKGSLSYKNNDYEEYIKNNDTRQIYSFSENDERIMYIVHNYDNKDLNMNYEKIFKSSIYIDFKNVIDIFIHRKRVTVKEGKVFFNFKSNSIGQFELIELYSDNILKLYEGIK